MTAVAAAAGAVIVLAGGCQSASGVRPGAPAPSTRTGPTVVSGASLPPLVARDVPTDEPSPARESAVQRLSNRIDVALTSTTRSTPAARLSVKAAAGNQLIIRWLVGADGPSRAARDRVRRDAITIMGLVRDSGSEYGSVLLLATGTTLVHDKKKVSIVVRAKFSGRLTAATDWPRVSPEKIFKLPDDKPAVIAVDYR